MKNLIKVLILVLVAVPSLCLASAFDTNVKFGDRGQEVVKVQQFLQANGYFNHEITGNFFGITKQAVKDFQTDKGIISTGFFGPLSRGVANAMIVDIMNDPAPDSTPVNDISATTTPERQMIQEEPIYTVLTASAPVDPQQCVSNGSDIWNDVKYSDLRAKSFVWFGDSKELDSFVVTPFSSTTVQVSIPAKIRNDSGFDMSYQVFYSVADVGTQLQDTENVISSSLPITINLSDEYVGHKVAFQLLVSYNCLKQYVGWNYMKANSNSFQYLQM